MRKLGVPAGRRATKFCLVVAGQHLPAKYVMALAARRMLGRELRPDEFSGGAQTNSVLKALGFVVRSCSCGGDVEGSAAPRRGSSPVHGRTDGANRRATILRLVTKGRPVGEPAVGEKLLLQAFKHSWPADLITKFVITPGGFLQAPWPEDVVAQRGWKSRPAELRPLLDHAEAVLRSVVTRRVFLAAKGKTKFLTIGIDLRDGPKNSHAEFVAVYDIGRAKLVGWTGKSYPTPRQERALVQVSDVKTHLMHLAGERILVLGCHDLNMFSPRARANQAAKGERRRRSNDMRDAAREFQPTVVLQHPHDTDTPNIWRLPWLSLARDFPSVSTWASGIAYGTGYKRARLDRVLALTKSDEREVVDIVLTTST